MRSSPPLAMIERIDRAYRGDSDRVLPKGARLGITILILTVSVFVAARFGLVALIANGYRWLAFAFLAIYVLPLMTLGLWRLLRGDLAGAASGAASPAVKVDCVYPAG